MADLVPNFQRDTLMSLTKRTYFLLLLKHAAQFVYLVSFPAHFSINEIILTVDDYLSSYIYFMMSRCLVSQKTVWPTIIS